MALRMPVYVSASTSTSSATTSTFVTQTISTGNRIMYGSAPAWGYNRDVEAPENAILRLKDGSVLSIVDGNWTLDDSRAKIRYKGKPTREFNEFLNASDMLEKFIEFAGFQGVSASDFLKLPIDLFIAWLVIEAAEKDGEDVDQREITDLKSRISSEAPTMLSLQTPQKLGTPRCRVCGRFVHLKKRDAGAEFCSPDHASEYVSKI